MNLMSIGVRAEKPELYSVDLFVLGPRRLVTSDGRLASMFSIKITRWSTLGKLERRIKSYSEDFEGIARVTWKDAGTSSRGSVYFDHLLAESYPKKS